MKKVNSFFESVKPMTISAVATMALTSVFGLTSCQDDNADCMQTSQDEKNSAAMGGVQDSIYVNTNQFVYDKSGAKSHEVCPEIFDYGFSMSDLDTRSAGADNLAFTMLTLASSVMNTTDQSTSGVKMLMEQNGKVMEELNQKTSQMQDVLRAIDKLQRNSNDQEMNDIYDKYMKCFVYVKSYNCSTFNTYCKALALNKDMADHIMKNWLSQRVRGGDAPTAALDFLKETVKPMGKYHVTDIYDYMVFQNTAWEHEGYQMREQLRMSDICAGIAGYLLARDYYIKNQMSVDELDAAFCKFASFYMANNKVERHPDMLICQIQGAHIVFRNNLTIRDMENFPWTKIGGRWTSVADFMYGECGMKTADVISNTLSNSEAKAIYNFYNNGRAESEKLTFEQIMKQVGFDCSNLSDGMRHVMPLNDGANRRLESYLSNKYHMTYSHAVLTNEAKAFYDNWEIARMKFEKRDLDRITTYYFLGWADYKGDCQYFRTNIMKRYNGTNPF